ARTHDGGLPSFEMQIQPLWAYDLIDHVQFWQTEQGFDTIDIHEQGSFFWVTCFLECCEESCACQQPLSVPCYQAQTLASNLAKSHFFLCVTCQCHAERRDTMPTVYVRRVNLKDSLSDVEVVTYWRFLLEEVLPAIQRV